MSSSTLWASSRLVWITRQNAGWWFGTFFNFPYIGNNNPNWLEFSEGLFHHQPEMAVEISLATRVGSGCSWIGPIFRWCWGEFGTSTWWGELPTNPLGRLVLKLYHIVFYNKTIYPIWYFIILYIYLVCGLEHEFYFPLPSWDDDPIWRTHIFLEGLKPPTILSSYY